MTDSNINLRAMEPGDIDALFRWENDSSLWLTAVAHQPYSRHALQQFIDESGQTDIYASRQLRLMAYDKDSGDTVGCVDLFDFDPYHRRAGIGILVDSTMRHKGYGYAMLCELEKFASEHLNLHQIYCNIAEDNTASINLFTKAGFTHCGTYNHWIYSRGEWIDALAFQKILE